MCVSYVDYSVKLTEERTKVHIHLPGRLSRCRAVPPFVVALVRTAHVAEANELSVVHVDGKPRRKLSWGEGTFKSGV